MADVGASCTVSYPKPRKEPGSTGSGADCEGAGGPVGASGAEPFGGGWGGG